MYDGERMNQDEIKDILAKNYGINDPERVRAMITFNDGMMHEDQTFSEGKAGVDLSILELLVSLDLEHKEKHGSLKQRYYYEPTIPELVWEHFRKLLGYSIKANLL